LQSMDASIRCVAAVQEALISSTARVVVAASLRRGSISLRCVSSRARICDYDVNSGYGTRVSSYGQALSIDGSVHKIGNPLSSSITRMPRAIVSKNWIAGCRFRSSVGEAW
jgi:hypothetical protein